MTDTAAPFTAHTVITDIQDAFVQFGQYNYYDKGAGEVMDMSKWCARFFALGPEKAGEVLKEVLLFEHGEPFVSWVVCEWDVRDDFDALLDSTPELQVLY